MPEPMNLFVYVMFGAACSIILGIVAYIWWLGWYRERTVQSVRENPTSVLRAWVEPPNDTYSVFRLKIKTLKCCKVVAAHAEIQRVLPLLEQMGVHVHDAPAWCRDPSKQPPEQVLINFPESKLSLIVNGIISPLLLLGLLAATLWSFFSR
jgi:hypothetical protein